MKTTILLFLISCTFAGSLSGADKKRDVLPLSYNHPLIEFYKKHNFKILQPLRMSKTTETAQLDAAEHQIWDGAEFSPYYKTEFFYQMENRVENRHSYKYTTESEWEVESRELFTYESGRIITILEQIKIGNEYVNDYRSLFTYQQGGNQSFLKEGVDQYWSEDIADWENDERIVLTIEDDYPTGGANYVWEEEEWILYDRFTFTEQDDDLYLTHQEFNGEEWENTEREIFIDYSIADFFNLFIMQMDYLDSGSYLVFAELMPDYTEQYWSENEWRNYSRQITEINYDMSTEEPIEKFIWVQEYDEDSANWITYSELKVDYEENLAKKSTLSTLDELNDDLLPEFSEEYVYNDMDLLVLINQSQLSEEEFVLSNRIVLQWSGVTTGNEDEYVPFQYSLGYAYPNPFNPVTTVPFETGNSGDVRLKVYDMIGRQIAIIADGFYPAGSHTVRFDASGLSSGVYLIRFEAPGEIQTRRVTLLK